jgi:hypothetical protein
MTIVRASACSRDGVEEGPDPVVADVRDRSACSFLAMRVPRDRSRSRSAS